MEKPTRGTATYKQNAVNTNAKRPKINENTTAICGRWSNYNYSNNNNNNNNNNYYYYYYYSSSYSNYNNYNYNCATTTTTTSPQLQLQLQLQLRYNYTTLHYTKRHYTNYSYSHNYNYATLHYTTLDYTTYTTLDYITLDRRPITPLQFDCNYTTLATLHHNYNSITLQLRLQLQYTTLHPAAVGEVTTATIATSPKKTQLQPPFGQSVDSLCHPWFTTTNLSYRFPILKLPPPPCAVLLVFAMLHYFVMIYTWSARNWDIYTISLRLFPSFSQYANSRRAGETLEGPCAMCGAGLLFLASMAGHLLNGRGSVKITMSKTHLSRQCSDDTPRLVHDLLNLWQNGVSNHVIILG